MTRLEPKQDRASTTRQALLNSALTLGLDRGVENVTSSDVTADAGVSVGVFYRYFASIGDLWDEFGVGPDGGTAAIRQRRLELNGDAFVKRDNWDPAATASRILAGNLDPNVPGYRAALIDAGALIAAELDRLPGGKS